MNNISYLVCPVTKQGLSLLDEKELLELNQRILSGQVKKISGLVLSEKLNAVLIRADKKVAYQIVDEIPILTKEEAILI